jgi:hypothetical protein
MPPGMGTEGRQGWRYVLQDRRHGSVALWNYKPCCAQKCFFPRNEKREERSIGSRK